MADGFFSFLDVTKVNDKPEPTRPFILFWYRYAKRFFHLLRVNFIFFLITLPFLVWTMTMYNSYIVGKGLENIALLPALITYYLESVHAVTLGIFAVISIACWGPAWAGLTFVTSRYAQGRHAWAWVDFRDAFRENLKQAIPVGVAEALFVFVTFYYLMEGEIFFGTLGGVVRIVWFILMIIYMSCRMHLFPMMVSVDLPLGQLLKNSLLLAFIKPLRTLICFAVLLVLVILCSFADMFMLPLFAYAFFAFASSAVTYPVLKKYLLDPARQEQDDDEAKPQKEK